MKIIGLELQSNLWNMIENITDLFQTSKQEFSQSSTSHYDEIEEIIIPKAQLINLKDPWSSNH